VPGLRELLFGSGRSIGGTVYGTIVAMSVIAVGASAADVDVGRLAAFVGTTAIVFWAAHVYAHGLAESIDQGRHLDAAELRSVARRESSILFAAVAPTAALLAGAIGLLRESRAVWLALGIGVATLAVEGWRYATLEDLGRLRTVLVVALNVALGLVIVGLEAALSH
jgi:hypothetical protein